eukprot:CAMPEP_0174897486 /NCGR_PEP_ID=MMETSP0167-20121228/14276_1 /TAXON_ID=38298 /ORGANISM="Rhodella maculata, Strain CCMP736" /LENGTH=64 /DNA_ID=CAMNT_0016137499 /DNA_START=1 /DNA_END=191 /DNA_ORIENTATION=-
MCYPDGKLLGFIRGPILEYPVVELRKESRVGAVERAPRDFGGSESGSHGYEDQVVGAEEGADVG